MGKDKSYVNPFLLLEPLVDTQAPWIKRIGVAKNHKVLEAQTVKGEHSLFVEAYDLTLHDKFQLPPYKISYSIDGTEEKLLWEFIHLPGGASDEKFINDFYLSGTCGNYSCRKFFFNLNFTPENPRAQMLLAPGPHEVKVTVEDIVGNSSEQTFRWIVEG